MGVLLVCVCVCGAILRSCMMYKIDDWMNEYEVNIPVDIRVWDGTNS